MSKQTVIDWHSSSLFVASCSGRGASTRLDSISRQSISPDGESGSKTASKALTKAVEELGLAKSEATLLASREMVEVRTVSVPRIDSSELPDVIRFQAQRQLANMSDNWTLDFLMLPQEPGQEMQTALVCAISPANMAELAGACSAANLQLAHIALAPLEIARYVLATNSLSTAVSVVVCLSDENADLLILKSGKVILLRGTKLPSERTKVPAVVAGEVRRSLMAASSQLAATAVENVLLLATPAMAKLVEQPIGDAVGAPVSILDPTELLPTSLADREQIASESANRIFAIAGAASLATADKATVIDFADPKRRPPPKSNTVRYILAAAAALMLTAAGVSWWISSNQSLDAELAQYEQEVKDKQPLVASAKKKVAQLAEIETILDRSPNFLDEFTYLASRIPPSEKVLLGGPMCSILADGRAQILVPVAADENTTISEFEELLRDENHEVVRRDPQRIDGATGLYAWQTVETIRISGRGWSLLDDGTPARSPGGTVDSGETGSSGGKVEPAGDSESAAEEPEADVTSAESEATQPENKNKPVPDDAKQAASINNDESAA